MRGLVRIVAILGAAGAVAAFPPAAAAKGSLQVCGASACAPLAQGEQTALYFTVGDTPPLAPATPAPYYEIRFVDHPGTLAYWIPSAHALRFSQGSGVFWTATTADQEAALTQATQGLAPHAAPTRVFATVDSITVKHPRGWLTLYTIGTPVAGAPGGAWLAIFVSGPAPSPWTDGGDTFLISRRGAYLERDGQFVRISAAVARRIRARLPLA
jgi:hypothetical protein